MLLCRLKSSASEDIAEGAMVAPEEKYELLEPAWGGGDMLSGRRDGIGGGPLPVPMFPAGRVMEGREANGTGGLSGERLGLAFSAPTATAALATTAALSGLGAVEGGI